jgi:hypothetical protein
MTTQHLSTRMIAKKPKNARNCEGWASFQVNIFAHDFLLRFPFSRPRPFVTRIRSLLGVGC